MIRVSVCIPARNHGRFLEQAVRSALDQPVDGLEVLVHDDASDDHTAQVLAGIDDSRLRVLRHPRPVGIARNRTSCLERARGAAVAWLDADDRYLPASLARRLEALDRHPRVGLVHGGFLPIDEGDRRLPPWPQAFAADTVQPRAQAFMDLVAANTITTSTVVVRRSLHQAAGPFATSIGSSSSDWEMWMRLALRADIAWLAEPVACYRQHAGSISRATARGCDRLRCDVRAVHGVLERERSLISDPGRVRATADAALAAKALVLCGDLVTAGRRRRALEASVIAARLAPGALGADGPRLLLALVRGDDYAGYRATRRALARLAARVGSPRQAGRLARAAAIDPEYEAMQRRAAAVLRRVTPRRATVASATKWDPTVLALSGRRGLQFPDRRRMPDGYPRDDRAAVEHLESLAADGVTHIAFTGATRWWLDRYPGLGEHLHSRAQLVHDDRDCLVYRLAA